ncbi:MarR family winged helix-turn-helix transcriptional regulator [Massilia sp. LXY-6]|uniref:MarR family winged helix-turn-helix transcriptional regulator n=1 Tax=Massilia sp. LXY-6 TaxID=3379823 RepID=UPI003EE1B1A4
MKYLDGARLKVFAGASRMAGLIGGSVTRDTGAGLDDLISGGLSHLVNAVRNAVFMALEHELAPLDLTASQLVVVIGAMRGRARTVNEFCRFAGIDAGSMSRLLDRLEAKDIVRRVRDSPDRRQVNVELTAKGSALYPQVMSIIARVNRRFLAGFSAEDAAQLQALMLRLLANHRDPEAGQAPP